MDKAQLDRLCIDTIRTLSMDALQRASSGHPGTPMALAPVAFGLWLSSCDCFASTPARQSGRISRWTRFSRITGLSDEAFGFYPQKTPLIVPFPLMPTVA